MPKFDEQLKETIVTGTDMLRMGSASAGVSFVLIQQGILGVESDLDFAHEAYFGIAKEGLWDETVDPAEAMKVMDRLPATAEWGNTLADTGKYLACDERFIDRGHLVLRKAALIFEDAYASMGDDSLDRRAQVLLEDYFRVAKLRDEAGDREGAYQTATAVAPHLIKLSDDVESSPDEFDRSYLEREMNLAIQYVGGLGSVNAKEMFNRITDEAIKDRAIQMALEKVAVDLLAVGRVESALAVYATVDSGGPLNCWEEVDELWHAGQHETVGQFIDGVVQTFPDYFKGDVEVITLMTSVVKVLDQAGRDDLLSSVFNGMIEHDSDLLPIQQFAYRCGITDRGQRLTQVTSDLALTDQQKTKLYEAYQQGVDGPAQPQDA